MAKFCTRCGTPLNDTSAFCNGCGAPAPMSVPVPSASAPNPSFTPPATPSATPPTPAPVPASAPYQPVSSQPVLSTPFPNPPQYTNVPSGTPQPNPYAQPVQPQPGQAQPNPYAQPMPGQPQPMPGQPKPMPGQPQPNPYTASPNLPPSGAGNPPPASGGGSALKIILIVVAVIGLAVLSMIGGCVYMVHRAAVRIQDTAREAGLPAPELGGIGHGRNGDPCRYLTATDVGNAIGVTIVDTKGSGNTCHYLAIGSPNSMSSKHIAATVRQGVAHDGTSAQQDAANNLIGHLLGGQPDSSADSSDPNQKTSVLDISVQPSGGLAQMKLETGMLGGRKSGDGPPPGLEGIGDDAFVLANNLMLVRKGDSFIQITYSTCPCGTEQIKPLAQKLANSL